MKLYFICTINICVLEHIETERLHRDTGPYGEQCDGILADGLAGESLLYRHANENLRFHQGKNFN